MKKLFVWVGLASVCLGFRALRAEENKPPEKIKNLFLVPLPAGEKIALSQPSHWDRAYNRVVVFDAKGDEIFSMPNAESPALSPDGKSLAFVRMNGIVSGGQSYSQGDIWIAPLDGGAPRQITSSRDSEYSPSWSPDGKQLVFASDKEGHFGNGYGLVEIMNADGSERHAITKDDGSTYPAWSPDGKQIAFIRFGICVMDTQGKNRYRLTNAYSARGLAWRPDGKYLAFSVGEDDSVVSREGGRDGPIIVTSDDICTVRAERPKKGKTADVHCVTDQRFDYQKPAWSRDGKWLLCESDKDGVPLPQPLYDETFSRGPYNIYLMRADGKEFRRLTRESDWQNASWR